MVIFEALMLICFGVSWPISIMKALRTKVVAGKSPLFMSVVFIGYLSGITYKLTGTRDWVVYLYVMNAIFVLTDLCLYMKYMPGKKAAG